VGAVGFCLRFWVRADVANEVLSNVMVVEFGPNLSCFLLVTDVVVAVIHPLSDIACWLGHDGLCHCVS